MGFIDFLVNGSFKEGNAGRAVIFAGSPRNRGYLVGSQAEEQKIRAFLRMYYFAYLSIQLLGALAFYGCANFFVYALLDRPARHLLSTAAIALVIYALLSGLPFFFFWKSYKTSLQSFISRENEVDLSGISGARAKGSK